MYNKELDWGVFVKSLLAPCPNGVVCIHKATVVKIKL